MTNQLQQTMASFWRGQYKNLDHKINWDSWSTMCKNLKDGGLGFRELSLFNQTLLAKNGWNLVTAPYMLSSKILQAKYYPNKNFLEATKKNNASYV